MNMPKFKVGDKVRIVAKEELLKLGKSDWDIDYHHLYGIKATIQNIDEHNSYYFKEFTANMRECEIAELTEEIMPATYNKKEGWNFNE